MAYLAALSADTGVPLFSRTKGDVQQLPFPVIGALNGVQVFAARNSTSLISALSEDAKIVWKVFHDKLTLILVAGEEGSTDVHFHNMLDYIFRAMVSLMGFDNLLEMKNTERLKRESRLSFSLVDTLLFGTELMGPLTHAVDIIATPETPVLVSLLNAFAEAAETQFACAFIRGKIVAATDSWMDLSPYDAVILSLLCSHHPKSSCQDTPVYLPEASPNTPHRLLSFKVVDDFVLALLCESKPTLEEVRETILPDTWLGHLDTIHKSLQCVPRNLPPYMSFEPSLLGFLLVNNELHRCLCSYQLGSMAMHSGDSNGDECLPPSMRRMILASYNKTTVGPMFPHGLVQEGCETDLRNNVPHQPVETYLCSEDYKCYALHFNYYQLFTLFSADTPTYSMRSLSYSTLDTVTTDPAVSVYMSP